MCFLILIFLIPTANSFYVWSTCMQTSFAKLQETYSRMKVKCYEVLTSPFQPKLTLFQQQIHSLPLQTNQQDQHTFLGQTFLGNISWLELIYQKRKVRNHWADSQRIVKFFLRKKVIELLNSSVCIKTLHKMIILSHSYASIKGLL